MRGTCCFHNSSGYFIVIIAVTALLALLAAPAFGVETKTAYTRDGINFISKERMEENIRYEYARPGDYREVQVPMDTVIVGESFMPENISHEEKDKAQAKENNLSSGLKSTAPTSASSHEGNYPYAPISIVLLVVSGLVFVAASIFSRRRRR